MSVWIEVLIVLAAAQLVVSAVTLLAVCYLFLRHDGSVLAMLNEIIKAVELRMK